MTGRGMMMMMWKWVELETISEYVKIRRYMITHEMDEVQCLVSYRSHCQNSH
jgi:hypothetical protein